MKKILVPTDFSQPARIAAEVAADIAKKSNAKVILLHVVEQPGGESYNVEGEISTSRNWEDKLFTFKMIDKSKKELAKELKELKDKGVDAKSEIRLGNPFHGMKTTIAETDVDLVVMGTSGHSKLEEMIIGSNTEKVVRYARCPVLTVHKKPASGEYKNIVFATSMSGDEKQIVSVVKNTQQMYKATVHLVRINTPQNFQRDSTVKRLMDAYAKRNKLEDYTLNCFSDYTEEEGIIHFAESIGADLICMATHGRKGFAHVLSGSIAEDVVNHSKRPVLTYVTR